MNITEGHGEYTILADADKIGDREVVSWRVFKNSILMYKGIKNIPWVSMREFVDGMKTQLPIKQEGGDYE